MSAADDDQFTEAEAAERFEVAMKKILGKKLTPEEDVIRRDILARMPKPRPRKPK